MATIGTVSTVSNRRFMLCHVTTGHCTNQVGRLFSLRMGRWIVKLGVRSQNSDLILSYSMSYTGDFVDTIRRSVYSDSGEKA